MTKTITLRKRRMKESLSSSSSFNQSMTTTTTNLCSLFHRQQSNLVKFGLLALVLISLSAGVAAASTTGTRTSRNINSNIRYHNEELPPPHSNSRRSFNNNNNNNIHHRYRLLDHQNQNEYDSSIDDDTLRLSLAIDDDVSSSSSAGGGGGLSSSAPSLHSLEPPRVYLRVSGESGMIRPDYHHQTGDDNDDGRDNHRNNNEVINGQHSFQSFRASSPSIPSSSRGEVRRTDLHFKSDGGGDGDDDDEGEDAASEDEDLNENYQQYPYIESYREKLYVRPESSSSSRHFIVTTTPSPLPPQPLSFPSSSSSSSLSFKKGSLPSSSSQKQEWSDIIAQVTTPSSFNEINSSASEHRLADFHLRAKLPSYFYNKYSTYSEEDLENVADLDDEHSKYFVKTRPRSVTAAGSNIYSNFYYEPPSFSTKSVPIPVKTKEKVFFVSAKPTQYHHQLFPQPQSHHPHHPHSPLFEEGEGSRPIQHHQHHQDDDVDGDNDEELAQQDSPVMTTISSNFSHNNNNNNNIPSTTPPQMSYDREEGEVYRNHQQQLHQHFPNTNPNDDGGILKISASTSILHPPNDKNYQKTYQNLSNNNNASNNNSNKSSAETLDVSTSQSILSKVTVNNPRNLQYNHHPQPHSYHPQFVHIRPDFHAKPAAAAVATPEHRRSEYEDDNVDRHNIHHQHDHHQHHHHDGEGISMTSGVKIASSGGGGDDSFADTSSSSIPTTTTEHPLSTIENGGGSGDVESTATVTTPASTVTTTTDATSIPGIPGVDYPTLGEIPQTGFDCQKQRYKGFFADIDAKCQAWHYCDFHENHSTFLCPNGTLFSQVLLTCDWWFNVDCKLARQLYVLNERLYRYIKPPKPSFPEDFIGEHVDKWLLQQFNSGYLPKVRRKKAKPKYATLPTRPPPSQPMDDPSSPAPTEDHNNKEN